MLILNSLCKMMDGTCKEGSGLLEVLWLSPDDRVHTSFNNILKLKGGAKSGTFLGFPHEKWICYFIMWSPNSFINEGVWITGFDSIPKLKGGMKSSTLFWIFPMKNGHSFWILYNVVPQFICWQSSACPSIVFPKLKGGAKQVFC